MHVQVGDCAVRVLYAPQLACKLCVYVMRVVLRRPSCTCMCVRGLHM